MAYRLLYATASSQEEAKRLACLLVQEKLAACVNILGEMTAFYRWEGALQEKQEISLLIKTTAQKIPPLIKRFQEEHSYDCPAILSLPIAEGNPTFLKWISESVEEKACPHEC